MECASPVLAVGLDEATLESVRRLCDARAVELLIHPAVDSIDLARGASLALCEIELFDALRAACPTLPVAVIASVADSRQMIAAMKRGAIECLLPPFDEQTLHTVIDQARQATEPPAAGRSARRAMLAGDDDGIIGQSPAMQAVYKQIGLIAPRDVNVLITGESGTGKEIIARSLHGHSARHDKPLLAVNCAAIPETLLESELFGHERGAFTGADRQKAGKFEQAHGGTLFFDEIGDMPLATQAKLLRVLQDQRFQRLGGSQTIQADVRIIAATHQPLEQLITARTFRQDLYYRLKVATIHLPPLRQREVDAVLLAHYFVERFNPQLGAHITSFSPPTVKALLGYDWPGNVRELENVIKAALLGARGSVFQVDLLPESIRRGRTADAPTGDDPAAAAHDHQALVALVRRHLADPREAGQVHRAVMDQLQRVMLTEALNHTAGHQQRAAELLGISRTTLRQHLRRLGITLQVSANS